MLHRTPWGRRLILLGINLALAGALVAVASWTTLGPLPARARAELAPDTAIVTAQLDEFSYRLEDERTALFTVTATGRVYLARTATEVLAGAAVTYEIPKLGFSGTLAEEAGKPGAYRTTHTERVRVQSSVPFLSTRGWQVRDLQLNVDGDDLHPRLTRLDDRRWQAKNWFRHDVKAEIRPYDQPRRIDIRWHIRGQARILKADGTPAAGVSLTVSLPDRGWSETFTTDAEGWVRVDRVEEGALTLQGGRLERLASPLEVAEPDDPMVLFWWEEPTERCQVDVSLTPGHGAAAPGTTAVFDFFITNLGNRPKTFAIRISGVPAEWVDQETQEVFLLPFFQAAVRIGVTPARDPATAPAPYTLTATAETDCVAGTASAGFKVNPYHEPAVAVSGQRVFGADRMEQGLLLAARKAEARGEAMDLLVLARGPVDDAMRKDIARLGGTVRREFRLAPGFSLRLPAGKVDDLAALPWVERVQQNHKVRALLASSVPALGAPALWDLGLTGKGITVAVVDTGVDAGHPALAGAVLPGWNVIAGNDQPHDGHGHGTHVAGIIASRDATWRGVAPGARILPVKVLDDGGWGTEEGVIAGIEWAVEHGADVINLSLGAEGGDGSSALARAVDAAVQRGVVVVAAAGNGGPWLMTIGTPGDSRFALTVGATDNGRAVAEWSSRGPLLDGRTKPDLVAPGVDVTSTWPGGGFEMMAGTSMSTAHISGLAALLLEGAGRIDPLLLKEALRQTALDLGYGPNTQGAGFPDPVRALTYARERRGVVQQTVYPGETAAFPYTLTNRGNVDDTFRLSQTYYSFGYNKFAATPDRLGGDEVEAAGGSVFVPSGQSVRLTARVPVSASWAGMEDTVYPLAIVARSAADPQAVDFEYVTVKVKATKRSKFEYVRREAGWFKDDAAGMQMDAAYKQSLLKKADQLIARTQAALDAARAGSWPAADERLGAADAYASDLQADIRQAAANRKIKAADADALQRRLESLRQHMAAARATAPR